MLLGGDFPDGLYRCYSPFQELVYWETPFLKCGPFLPYTNDSAGQPHIHGRYFCFLPSLQYSQFYVLSLIVTVTLNWGKGLVIARREEEGVANYPLRQKAGNPITS